MTTLFVVMANNLNVYTSAAIEAEAIAYGGEYYPMGTAAVYASKEDNKTVITIAISASRFQGQNFKYVLRYHHPSSSSSYTVTHASQSNGRWRSVWQCTMEGRTGA